MPPSAAGPDDFTAAATARLMPNPWQLLEQDDTRQIVGMLTPCSTLTESKSAVATLQHYYCQMEEEEDDDDDDEAKGPRMLLRTTLGIHPYHVTDDDLLLQQNGKRGTEEEDANNKDSSIIIQACMQELRDLYRKASAGTTTSANWVVAVGETGLDQAPGFPPLERQLPWFRAQIQLALELNLPLFVHERLAFDETLHELEDAVVVAGGSTAAHSSSSIPVLVHCFTGNAQQLEIYLERGYYISLAGGFLAKRRQRQQPEDDKQNDTKKNDDSDNATSVYQALPRLWAQYHNQVLLETDAPYMGFKGCRSGYLQHHETAIAQHLTSKKRKRLLSSTYPNVPSSLELVLDMVHQCFLVQDGATLNDSGDGETETKTTTTIPSRHEIAQITTANARRFFGLLPSSLP